MCQEKEARGQKRAKFAQHLAQEGLLLPLGDWINGLPGRYNQQPPSAFPPRICPKSGNLVVGRWDSAYVPDNVLCPSLSIETHAGPIFLVAPW